MSSGGGDWGGDSDMAAAIETPQLCESLDVFPTYYLSAMVVNN